MLIPYKHNGHDSWSCVWFNQIWNEKENKFWVLVFGTRCLLCIFSAVNNEYDRWPKIESKKKQLFPRSTEYGGVLRQIRFGWWAFINALFHTYQQIDSFSLRDYLRLYVSTYLARTLISFYVRWFSVYFELIKVFFPDFLSTHLCHLCQVMWFFETIKFLFLSVYYNLSNVCENVTSLPDLRCEIF